VRRPAPTAPTAQVAGSPWTGCGNDGDGALAHLDTLTLRYTGKAPFFGKCVPAKLEEIPASHCDLLERAAHPKVNLLVVDPDDTGRYLQIRGDAELIEKGALDHLDRLTRRCIRCPSYYGYIYPLDQQFRETGVTCRMRAQAITRDAIHH
jgi:Pyridoxamine 5'-phosphate oxidase